MPRVRIDSNGLRVSQPGYDVDGPYSGLLLDISMRYGQIMEHGSIGLNTVRSDTVAGSPSYNQVLERNGTIIHGAYSSAPGILVFGSRAGQVVYPAVDFNSTGPVPKWRQTLVPSASSCTVSFRPWQSQQWNTTDSGLPDIAIYVIYRKLLNS